MLDQGSEVVHINTYLFLSDEGPMLETLDYTIRIGSTATFLYFDLYLYSTHTTFLLHINTGIRAIIW